MRLRLVHDVIVATDFGFVLALAGAGPRVCRICDRNGLTRKRTTARAEETP